MIEEICLVSEGLVLVEPVPLMSLHLQTLSRYCLLTVLILLQLEREALADASRCLEADIGPLHDLTVVVRRVYVARVEHL